MGKDNPCPTLCAIYREMGKLVHSTWPTWARPGHSFPFPPRFMSTRSLWTTNLLAIGFYRKGMKIVEFCTHICDTNIKTLLMWQSLREPTWVEDASNVRNSTGLRWGKRCQIYTAPSLPLLTPKVLFKDRWPMITIHPTPIQSIHTKSLN